jgi:hypothetical protein
MMSRQPDQITASHFETLKALEIIPREGCRATEEE